MIPLRTCMVLILMFFISGIEAKESKTTFTITSFNIKFYAYHDVEKRDPYLQDFLKKSVPDSDLIVFEEIVDTSRIKNILPANWECLSYVAPYEGHQHVVICHSDRFKFVREPSDDNDLIDEVAGAKGSLRPAVTAIVTDKEGKQLFRLVGVHLKASPEYSKTRLEQAAIIADYLKKVDSKLPVVIAGDFNTYFSPLNKETENDKDLILKAFNQNQLNLRLINNDLFTFRSSYGQGQFDHFFVSDSMKATKPVKIFEMCNAESTTGDGLLNLAYYNEHISDHCPVSAEITL